MAFINNMKKIKATADNNTLRRLYPYAKADSYRQTYVRSFYFQMHGISRVLTAARTAFLSTQGFLRNWRFWSKRVSFFDPIS